MTARVRWIVVLSVAVTAALIVGIAIGRFSAAKTPAGPPPKLREYCSIVSTALRIDAVDLESGSEKRRFEAAWRFGELVTYHSEQEISLCETRPVDLARRGVCMLNNDYQCLAKLARAASDATKP